jgi:hypothetical protein
MGIDIAANGRWAGADATPDAMDAFAERLAAGFGEEGGGCDLAPLVGETDDGLAMELPVCAGCSPIEISIGGDGELALEARTSPGGPGYHRAVCEFIEQIGRDLGVEWSEIDDQTGYYESRDLSALEDSMIEWFQGLCHVMLREGEQPEQVSLCMPIGAGFRSADPAAIITPIGPRDVEWMRRCIADADAAREFFVWWGEEADARTLRNRAMALLWSYVVWAPAPTEEAYLAQTRAMDLMLAAHEADPTSPLPWRDFEELLDIVGVDESSEESRAVVALVRAKAAQTPASEPIGYLRHPVVYRPAPPWQLELPGSFVPRHEDGAFAAGDGARTVRLTAYELPDQVGAEQMLRDLASGGPEAPNESTWTRWSAGDVEGCGFFVDEEEDGETYRLLVAAVTAGNHGALVMAAFDDPSEEAWALEAVRGVRTS